MMRFRAFVVALACLSMPFSAMATLVQAMQCHHEGLGSIMAPAADDHDHDQVAQQAHLHHHHDDSAKADADDHGCDCAVKCTCEHHCASSGAAALAFAAVSVGIMHASADVSGGAYAAPLSDLPGRSVFRPPITALPSAA